MRAKNCTHATGFTLVELMIVVSILGILAALSIVSFRRYFRRAKVQEAYSNLSQIRQRQETYRSEFNQYADVAGNGANTGSIALALGAAGQRPASAPSQNTAQWGASTANDPWDQLGVRITGNLYYRYNTTSGPAGVAPATGGGLGYSSAPNQDAWFIAHAYGDLDGDGITTLFEAFSMVPTVYVTPEETE